MNGKRLGFLGAVAALILGTAAAPAPADRIVDFEKPQTKADFPANFHAIKDSTVKIDKQTGGITATLTNGELLTNAAKPFSDPTTENFDATTIYASTNGVDGLARPITIEFSSPVDPISILILNGTLQGGRFGDTRFAITGTTADGEALKPITFANLPEASSATEDLKSLKGIVSLTITSTAPADANRWKFAVDDLKYRVVPEPAAVVLLAVGLLGALGHRRQSARGPGAQAHTPRSSER